MRPREAHDALRARRVLASVTSTTVGLPVLALSADEILWALLRLGFNVVERDETRVVLASHHRKVELPLVATLAPEILMGLLRAAGLSYSELLDLLGEAPTHPGGTPGASGVRLKRHL